MSTRCSDRNQWQQKFKTYAVLPLRLIIGYGFVAHGLAKWLKGPAAFAAILRAASLPAPHLFAWATIAIELFCGLAFLAGAFVSLASIPAVAVLIGAVVTVHLPYGFSSIKLLSYSNGRAHFGPPGYECDLLYICCILTLLLNGPSPFSIDALLSRSNSSIH